MVTSRSPRWSSTRRPTAAPPAARSRRSSFPPFLLYAVSAAACCLLTVTSRAAFGDLAIYRAAGQAVLHGQPVYALRFAFGLQFTYPPFAALVFAPLSLLPASRLLVTTASVFALPVVVYLALRLPPLHEWLSRDQALRAAMVFSAAAIWLEPVRTDLKYGQVNAFITLLILADLALLRRGQGTLIGIAAGLKLTPAIFAVYLLATRRYRAAALSAVAFAATVAISFLVVPGDAARYWRTGLVDPSRVGRIQNVANQSLLGALARTLHTLDVRSVWLTVTLVVAVTGLTLAARAARRGDEATGFALCAVTELLVSPISWSHHWLLALPALAIATLTAARRQSRPTMAALSLVAVAGWDRLIWRVPTSGGHYAELDLTTLQLIAADAYVLAALAALFSAAVRELSAGDRWPRDSPCPGFRP